MLSHKIGHRVLDHSRAHTARQLPCPDGHASTARDKRSSDTVGVRVSEFGSNDRPRKTNAPILPRYVESPRPMSRTPSRAQDLARETQWQLLPGNRTNAHLASRRGTSELGPLARERRWQTA